MKIIYAFRMLPGAGQGFILRNFFDDATFSTLTEKIATVSNARMHLPTLTTDDRQLSRFIQSGTDRSSMG